MEELGEDDFPWKRKKMEETGHGVVAVITQENENRTFRLKGTIKGQRIIALVDSGATHDFISKHLVTKRKLKTQEFKSFKVSFGN